MNKKVLCFILSISTCLFISSDIVSATANYNSLSQNVKTNLLLNNSPNFEVKEQKVEKIRYIDNIFPRFKLDKDIKYKEAINYEGGKEKLLLDVYTPDGDMTKHRPVIIWVHGGALSIGSKDEQDWFPTIYSKEFAKKGYVAVNINYRLNPNAENDWNGSMKNAMEDVASAIDWVKNNSKKYKMDKNNIILAGYSAGAEIVTNLAYGTYVDGWNRKGISAVVDISGNKLFWGNAIKKAPPCTIIHGTLDDINPIISSEELVSNLKKSNIKCELNAIEGEDHFFKNNPNSSEKVQDIIIKFLYKNAIKK